jgi:hypothetical protein
VTETCFYVYQWVREDGSPFYIGKGNGSRAWKKTKGHSPPKEEHRIILVAHHLTESESFLLEKKLISLWGRKDLGTGILNNRTDGGQGSVGKKMTVESRAKLGQKVKQRLSDKTELAKHSERTKSQWADPIKKARLIEALRNARFKPEVIARKKARIIAREQKKKSMETSLLV